jgi:hypothetical protein
VFACARNSSSLLHIGKRKGSTVSWHLPTAVLGMLKVVPQRGQRHLRAAAGLANSQQPHLQKVLHSHLREGGALTVTQPLAAAHLRKERS